MTHTVNCCVAIGIGIDTAPTVIMFRFCATIDSQPPSR